MTEFIFCIAEDGPGSDSSHDVKTFQSPMESSVELRDLVSVYCALAPKARKAIKITDPAQMPLVQVRSLPVQYFPFSSSFYTSIFIFKIILHFSVA